ncbi:MAG: hypothetical protein QOF26_3481 [Baekduia sp.]|nr:hypothetical protein [Baekduia sp.]
MTDAALRDLAARAASGDGSARRALGGPARAQARDILAEDRFHDGHHGEGLLHGLFVRLGDWLEALTGALPGGAVSGYLLLAVVAAATAWVVGSLIARRRRRAGLGTGGAASVAAGAADLGPDELERRAADAERAGDLDAAVRLRFAAGLLRLDRADAIALHPSLTTGEIGRRLRSPRYDALARTHDAVAYGGRHAEDADAAAARDQWPAVVGEARRR